MVQFISLVLVLLTSSAVSSTTSRISLASTIIFDVMKYGAKGNGKTDDSQAFVKAWKAACQSTPNSKSILNIPGGRTYLLKPIAFTGPCRPSKIFVQVSGNIVGSPKKSDWLSNHGDSWILFSMVNGLTVSGNGRIDGQGPIWWKNACIGTPPPGTTCHAPVALQFKRCNAIRLNGLTMLNSPRVHITMTNCKGVIVTNLHIIAPETSPNTDGINIAGSSNVNIRDSVIGTGDDCIAISGGSSNIKISGIMCGPGHGISIGSLSGTDVVENVDVRNCTMRKTLAGVRIKTYQGGVGHAKKISFAGIKFDAVYNPILIDQYYCPTQQNCLTSVSGNIVGSNNKTDWMSNHGDSWILFSMVSGLSVSGNGQIDGQGPIWWENACIGTPAPVSYHLSPTYMYALQFKRCNGLRLNGLTHVNSPRVHITLTTCNGVIVSNLHIIAPETSPNTDGIDISGSTDVNIRDSIIATGDDCIAIGGGSSNIKISGITCGPGHGISIGSLGHGGTDVVEDVDVRNCTMRKTLTGVRIKTYQGGSGYAKKISFTDIRFDAVYNPIIIDQYYCPTHKNCQNSFASAVNLSDITYKAISGTSNTDNVINLSCSKTVACTNIVMDSVRIKSAIPGRKVYGTCINAHGRATHVKPYLDCLIEPSSI
ncbi:hypothetical protein E3N88_05449 [Mikania micrantha]|uniref:Pectate lyase superfamily protein domain-containing protein n=1 Tax=Mikania micrantha TaxID=192012 RepID=A0A5N6PKY9_9ASTR|nr:hypothetical protein E3N88_05449 [Mikania micrantha]